MLNRLFRCYLAIIFQLVESPYGDGETQIHNFYINILGDPLHVGMDLTIASFDAISEVNMVSHIFTSICVQFPLY